MGQGKQKSFLFVPSICQLCVRKRQLFLLQDSVHEAHGRAELTGDEPSALKA